MLHLRSAPEPLESLQNKCLASIGNLSYHLLAKYFRPRSPDAWFMSKPVCFPSLSHFVDRSPVTDQLGKGLLILLATSRLLSQLFPVLLQKMWLKVNLEIPLKTKDHYALHCSKKKILITKSRVHLIPCLLDSFSDLVKIQKKPTFLLVCVCQNLHTLWGHQKDSKT